MNIELHIDALVLRGLGEGHRHEIRAALERELIRLLETGAAKGAPNFERDVHRLDTPAIQVDVTSSPETIGTQLAGAIHGGLTG